MVYDTPPSTSAAVGPISQGPVAPIGPVQDPPRASAPSQIADLGGRWARLGALLMDLLVVHVGADILASMAAMGAYLATDGTAADWSHAVRNMAAFSSQTFPWLLAGYVLFFTVYGGQTLGKMVFDLRVVAVSGAPLSVRHGLMRTLGYGISFATVGLGFLLAAGRSRRALHDRIAGTRVVRTRRKKGENPHR